MTTDCCDARYSSGYGTYPYAITTSTRGGTRHYYAEWLPTGCRQRCATKREAVAIVKAHEDRCYGRKSVTQ